VKGGHDAFVKKGEKGKLPAPFAPWKKKKGFVHLARERRGERKKKSCIFRLRR